LMSDRGTPYGYRHMHGFGSHTFSLINAANERVWVKFHFKTLQGIKNFENDAAVEMKGKDADFAQRDLVKAIDNKEFPKWLMQIQVMTQEEAKSFRFNPFDLTKIWPHAEFPLIDVGELELNQIPRNFFADIEQSAFAPAHVVDGISYSPDKMLQGRLLSYPDAQRYRLGGNYEQIPVNRCPYTVNNYQRDGLMSVNGNGEDSPNYFPNSFDDISVDESYREPALPLDIPVADWFDRNAEGENDHYTQPGWLYNKAMNDYDRHNLVANIVGAMSGINGPKKDIIVNRQLCHFFRADVKLGLAIAKGLGVDVEQIMGGMATTHGTVQQMQPA
jgi:catalase